MSLVELLVVVAILGLLAVTVIPNFNVTKERRLGRESAQLLSAAISRAQSRAIGRTEWAGISVVAAAPNSYAAIDVLEVDQPPAYRGDTVPALLTVTGSLSPTQRVASGTQGQLTLSGSTGANVQRLDLIRFDSRGPWYEISNSPTPPSMPTSIPFRIRGVVSGTNLNGSETMGMSRHTTPWPPFSHPLGSGTVPLSFEILRRPVRAGTAVTMTDQRCIDLRWCCFGPATTVSASTLQPKLAAGSTRFLSAGTELYLLFDSTGRVRQYVVIDTNTAIRYTPTGPLLLLIGRTDRAGNEFSDSPGQPDDSTGANWQYPESYWVAVEPFTGIARFAECNVAFETEVPDTTDAIQRSAAIIARMIESQRWIRDSLLPGGQ